MDKEKFRELLQSFEQLSFKPEISSSASISVNLGAIGGGMDSDFETDSPSPRVLSKKGSSATFSVGSGLSNIGLGNSLSRRGSTDALFPAEMTTPDVDEFLALVSDNGTSFPELESTHPLLDHGQFRKPDYVASNKEQMHAQQQLYTAARFRFTASVVARLYFQLDNILKDRNLVNRGVRIKLTRLETDLVSLCSAGLIEAGQLEARAQRFEEEEVTTNVSVKKERQPPPNGAQPPVEMPLGARIKKYAHEWANVTSDPWVLAAVSEGVRFEFSENPVYVTPPEPEYSAEQSAAIEKVIRWDLGDKVIEEIPYNPQLFVSYMYTLPIGGKLKSLVEFRQLNMYLEAGNIKFEEPPSLSSLVCKNDWIARINIKCAYPSIPIHPEHQRFVVFKYDERYYQYRAMPFGISVANRVFTKLLSAALQPLIRDQGYRATLHIDEICLLNSSWTELTEQTKTLCSHLEALGFLINKSNSDLVPQQNQRFLGFVFNTLEGVIQFPKDQIKKVRRAATNARNSEINAKHLASLLGKLRSIMPAIGPELWRIQEIDRCLQDSITTPESWNDTVTLTPCALDDLGWICDNMLSRKSMPFASC